MNLLFLLLVALLAALSFADEQWSSYEHAIGEKEKTLAMVIELFVLILLINYLHIINILVKLNNWWSLYL